MVLVVLTLPVVELVVVFSLPVELVVVFTLPVELVVELTLVEFYEVELVTLAMNTGGATGNWHWHLLVGSTLVELTLLQSVH